MFDPRISIVTLGVSNMKKSRAFYEALGWTAAEISNENVTFFQGKGVILGLFGHDELAKDAGVATMPPPAFRGNSLAYNCNSKQAVDEAFAHALSCGANCKKEPQTVFWGGYSGYFSDPDGHLWEVAFNPFAKMDENGQLIIDEDTPGEPDEK